MNQEKQYARLMLDQREKGCSLASLVRRSAWRSLLLLLLAAGMLGVCLTTGNRSQQLLFLWGSGMFTGAILRDIGWMRRIRKTWPFSKKVTDWAKVEAIAQGEDGQST
jgi:hypothetical protein